MSNVYALKVGIAMNMYLDQSQLQYLLERSLTGSKEQPDSNLGFFSKPFRVKDQSQKEWMLKVYVQSPSSWPAPKLIAQHDEYVLALRASGILVPYTFMGQVQVDGKPRLVIAQEAFKPEELARHVMQEAESFRALELLWSLILEAHNFFMQRPTVKMGFHPTLRNYALSGGSLHYFDTFPPMLMDQRKLNKMVRDMAPYAQGLKWLVPPVAMNRVTNEYYDEVKMILGLIGSTCRLRPELAQDILKEVAGRISGQTDWPQKLRLDLSSKLQAPPRLPGIWVFFRKLFGKEGKPNI